MLDKPHMQLISLLQESSSLSLSDLKKAMMKDKRAADVFKKDLTIDDIEDIEDKAAFLSTIKYYLLNNERVRSFVLSRHAIKDIHKYDFDALRKLTPDSLDDKQLKSLKDFVIDIFKEHASVSKGVLSAQLKRELTNWVNTNGIHHDLSNWAQKELMSVESIRPDKRVLVYRGILFSEASLREREYNGTLEKGNGLKFIKSIRKGDRTVDLDWSKPSSWTTNKDVAEQFAKYGPASSNFSATLGWFHRGIEKRFIDGALGYVISTFVDPEDVLVDLKMLNFRLGSQHGDESEIILKPGTYLARVVKKYTVEGEVNPEQEGKDPAESTAAAGIRSFKELGTLAKLPEEASLLDDYYHNPASYDLLRHPSSFKKLLLNGTTTTVVHSIDKLIDFYNKHLVNLTDDELRADNFINSDELRRDSVKLKSFIKGLKQAVTHSKFQSENNRKGVGKKHELTGEEYRASLVDYNLANLEKDLLVRGKISDYSAIRAFVALAKNLNVTVPETHYHAMGTAKQDGYISEVLKAFFKAVGIDQPAERTEAIKTMLNLLKKAWRNAQLLQELKEIHALLGEKK